MPTENRPSNTDSKMQPLAQHPESRRERFLKWVLATKHPVLGYLDGTWLARGDDREGYADKYVQGLWVAFKEFAQPAPQSHPDPIAWMVGTAIWWTKEEAERDAAETGLMAVPVGQLTGTDEVERLRSIERSYGLRQALLEQVKGERDRMIARTMELSGQLADQDALLRKLKDALQREYWDEYAGLDETRELIDTALSTDQEPSTPANPYPNRICHIDYTAHPHRCGCLKGDEEAQRRYDEHCRAASERQP